ncbi:protein-tyrosine phosphatase [Dysgonomonas macrotermitis]|uniref:Protein-tyrosine phosphatase n=1 Tax=Dysgonomonas macrotermitis TaxID=1346286 RepID=A0A1M5CFJ2_9BACT|nr:protein-tyrosine phosphatase [Dysgonomonas macrotermitis]
MNRIVVKIKDIAITKLLFISSLLVSSGCSKQPEISFSCDRDNVGNYVLRWEVSPRDAAKKIKIYMSDDDSVFNEPPLLEADINDYVANIPATDSVSRKFFKLRVNDTYSPVISNHYFRMDNLQNFRDIGGYFTSDGRQIKWGKLYRSGDFSALSSKDYQTLNALGIRTVVDFRETEEHESSPDLFRGQQMISIPIASGNRSYIRERVLDGSFYRGDAIVFTQDMYKILIQHYSDEYAEFFDLLCDESNYPVVFHGYLGKDRTGLASYFLLRALGVPDDTNVDDYLFSNSCISEQQVIGEARFLPERMQEAATVICKADLSYLDYAKTWMISLNGSVDEYMVHRLGLTQAKREKLRQILLYP